MPSSDDDREQPRGGRLGSLLFWAGVGLAPLAVVLLLMVSGDGMLRAAIGVLTVSVLLVGLSMTMRRDGEALLVDLEDMVFDEADAVRADVRDDIATAAHATHRAFGEKLQYVMDQLQATRAELDATRAQLEALRAESARRGMSPVGAGRPNTAHPGGHHGPPAAAPGRPGVVRHTETVQVTTRHTVVDPQTDQAPRGDVYPTVAAFDRGAQQDADDFSTVRAEHQPASQAGRDESWTEQRMREQRGRRAEEPELPWAGRAARGGDDSGWPGVSVGDRWAAVRDDGYGRELRMGERRVAAHHGDSGAELRIEDRWAAVRQESARGGLPSRDDADPLGSGFSWQAGERDDRAAISGSDGEQRWSSYLGDYRDDPNRERRYR